MSSSKSDMYKIKDNDQKSNILIIILIILFIGTFLLLSSVYFMNYYLSQNIIDNVNFAKIKNILLIIACVLSFFSAILILFIGFKNNDEDYTKYQNYVMISKDDLNKLKKEIKHLKNKK